MRFVRVSLPMSTAIKNGHPIASMASTVAALLGARGGQSRSAKKLRACKVNLAKARAARHKKVKA